VEANSLEGIISYLTQKHRGHVHDKGIVTITSKSVLSDDSENAGWNLADFTSHYGFITKSGPDQWVCWDFHESRIRPSHYTIRSKWLKSWVIESSLDHVNWTEIDREVNKCDMAYSPHEGSFVIANPAQWRTRPMRAPLLLQTRPNVVLPGAFCQATIT
jgi:hypothetical protein